MKTVAPPSRGREVWNIKTQYEYFIEIVNELFDNISQLLNISIKPVKNIKEMLKRIRDLQTLEAITEIEEEIRSDLRKLIDQNPDMRIIERQYEELFQLEDEIKNLEIENLDNKVRGKQEKICKEPIVQEIINLLENDGWIVDEKYMKKKSENIPIDVLRLFHKKFKKLQETKNDKDAEQQNSYPFSWHKIEGTKGKKKLKNHARIGIDNSRYSLRLLVNLKTKKVIFWGHHDEYNKVT